MRNPLHYDERPQTMLSVKDCETLNLLDSLPRQLLIKRIVAILNSPRPRGDMLALMASHEGVGASQKIRFQLLREKVNARKKDVDALVGSSSGATGRKSEGGGTSWPPLPA
ncbi:hypothetical protein DEO72_LG3g1370 [Vigna unguiculata]|uniref:Uncharacterized protein n=1 Tax=Vigna unguiculata TaxID=3917 RepID=A0A4D6LEC8_VIGUN|nr:hypothetical protein DEO72_LG3g1370 [Vigna unguiculata]